MPKNLNSAARLLEVLNQALAQPDGTQVAEAWAKILGITEANRTRRAIAVGQLVHALHRELDIAAQGLEAAKFSKDLYSSAFSRIEHALSPLLLSATWNQVKQYLTADVLTALAFCTEILPDEESKISEGELDAIRERLGELRASLDNDSLPQRLRALVMHHLALIEAALAEYPVVGAKAFRAAGRTALGEIIEVKDELAAARDSQAVSKLEAAWKQVNSAADIALKSEKLAQLGQRAWDAITGMF
jgi:hypothetical protein